MYLSDLQRREEFFTEKEIENIMKYKMDNFDNIKLKRFCTTKPNVTKIRREAENWERIFATSICDEGLISKIYREVCPMYKDTSHSPIDKWSKDMSRQFSEEEIKAICSPMKKML